jgi:shikimate dehydrogenase
MKKDKLRLALIGKDVSKSISGRIHTFILKEFGVECEYEALSVSAEDFDSAMRRLLGDFDGFNVTIPYKRDVMGYLEEVTGDAFDCGAVNTVFTATRQGFNTDGIGFLLMLRVAGIEVKGKKVLVLGGGGSGRSSAAALKSAGALVHVYQRRREKLEELCNELGVFPADSPETGGYDILVNCTGVGMHDTEGQSPVTERAFGGAEWAVDLIYTPAQSEFLRLADSLGISTLNGASMLFYQAYYADCIYVEKTPDEDEAKKLYKRWTEVQK